MKQGTRKKPEAEIPAPPSDSRTTITIPRLPFSRRQLFTGLAILLVVAAIYALRTGFNTAKALSESAAQTSRRADDTLSKVSRIIELPQGETPRIGTVTDPAKLSSQSFFKDARKGDQVLIYDKAQKIILYRPSTNKVIQISTLKGESISEEKVAVQPTQNPQTTPAPLRITVLNGTETPGLAAATADKVKEQFSTVEITETGNTEGSYEETIVVDLTGKRKADAQQVATYLKGKLGALPQGESRPSDADIVVIVSE